MSILDGVSLGFGLSIRGAHLARSTFCGLLSFCLVLAL